MSARDVVEGWRNAFVPSHAFRSPLVASPTKLTPEQVDAIRRWEAGGCVGPCPVAGVVAVVNVGLR